ncbi:hypothetical protein V502_06439 [Pseudogymnoascus sp. VKM F-4520 (FW-2644)]|nr:hypothetical protein V502_06439 [Pseudogymnoascus sp. VKM F-4520 (FW-2644)]
MLFVVFITANIAWMSYQEAYLDVKELKTLRALPAELAKRNASLMKAEARVKELEAELAKPKQENQAASTPNIKYRIATIKAPKEQNWFSEQWGMYSYLKKCFKSAPEFRNYWQRLEKQLEATTAKADKVAAEVQEQTAKACEIATAAQEHTAKVGEVAATAQEQTVRLSVAEAQIEELQAQASEYICAAAEAAVTADAQVKELTVQVSKSLEGFKQQFAVKMLENKTRHANNAKELAASHAETQAHLKDFQEIHNRTETQINELKAQLTMSDQSKHLSPGQEAAQEHQHLCTWSKSSSTDLQGNFVGVLTQQLPGMAAEDRLLCPEEPKHTGGQENNAILQFEIATEKRQDQSRVTVAEEVKRLEVVEKKVEEEKLKADREQRHSRFLAAIQQDYEVLDMP